jgi:hypothetical protein
VAILRINDHGSSSLQAAGQNWNSFNEEVVPSRISKSGAFLGISRHVWQVMWFHFNTDVTNPRFKVVTPDHIT